MKTTSVVDELLSRLKKPFHSPGSKFSSLNRQYLYQGTGFHNGSGGWRWDPPPTWEACMATEVDALTKQLQEVGRGDEAVALLQKLLPCASATEGGGTYGRPAFRVEYEKCRQRYTGAQGYLSEEVEVIMVVGPGKTRMRFTSLWLCRPLRPSGGDGDKLCVVHRRAMVNKMKNNKKNNHHRSSAGRGTGYNNVATRVWVEVDEEEEEEEKQVVMEVMQGAVEVQDDEGGGWSPVLTYSQEEAAAGGGGGGGQQHWLLTADLVKHDWTTVLLCSCLGQHRREGSMPQPRYQMRDILATKMLPTTEGGKAGGGVVVVVSGDGVTEEEEAALVRVEVGEEVSKWRAHIAQEEAVAGKNGSDADKKKGPGMFVVQGEEEGSKGSRRQHEAFLDSLPLVDKYVELRSRPQGDAINAMGEVEDDD